MTRKNDMENVEDVEMLKDEREKKNDHGRRRWTSEANGIRLDREGKGRVMT